MPNYKRSPCLYYNKMLLVRQVVFSIFVKNQHSGQKRTPKFVKLDGVYTICNQTTEI